MEATVPVPIAKPIPKLVWKSPSEGSKKDKSVTSEGKPLTPKSSSSTSTTGSLKTEPTVAADASSHAPLLTEKNLSTTQEKQQKEEEEEAVKEDDVESQVVLLQQVLEQAGENLKTISSSLAMDVLQKLSRFVITVDVLQSTGIGRIINKLRKHAHEEVAKMATELVANWKKQVNAAGS